MLKLGDKKAFLFTRGDLEQKRSQLSKYEGNSVGNRRAAARTLACLQNQNQPKVAGAHRLNLIGDRQADRHRIT